MVNAWLLLNLILLWGCTKQEISLETQETSNTQPLEWIHFDGSHFRFSDGRQFIVRGLDYKYNTVGYTNNEFNLVESDFKRMADWGVNVLRVRLEDTRAGWYPDKAAESDYLDGLDEVIRMANNYGIYVIVATNGAEQMIALYERPDDLLYEQAKFLPGTNAREHWLEYMTGIFERYRDHSGVLGFDALNEDFSFPPEAHDRLFIKDAHEALLARLRSVDTRHVYFQQPAGWDYSPELEVSMGHSLPDQNRIFGTKWFAMQNQEQRMEAMVEWAKEANTPLFLCETWVWDIHSQRANTMRKVQRKTLSLLDQYSTGWISLGYLPLVGLIREDRQAIHLMDEWIRPYPQIIGGTLISRKYNFEQRHLSLVLQLDGTGETEIFIPAAHTYPGGFRTQVNKLEIVVDQNGQITSQKGPDLITWDQDQQKLTISPVNREVEINIEALDSGPVPQTRIRLDYSPKDFAPQHKVVRPVFSLQEGETTLRGRMLSSGDWSEDQVDCIINTWKETLDPIEWEIVARAGLMQVDMRIRYTQAIFSCLGN